LFMTQTTLKNSGRQRLRTATVIGHCVVMCLVASAEAIWIGTFTPTVSPLIIAIMLGLVLANIQPVRPALLPGIRFTARRVLRTGIVLLGLQVVLSQIVELGLPALLVIVVTVVAGIAGTLLLGCWLQVSGSQSLLIACGFSICGAAAIAAVEGSTESRKGESATALALVVIFGSLMIPLVPWLGGLLGMEPSQLAQWAGASIHEVAQVTAVGEIIGGGALGVAVAVKLARVLMLAPVLAAISLQERIKSRRIPATTKRKLPPLVPLFVCGFLAMVFLRHTGAVPVSVLGPTKFIQVLLLSAAMFALGAGINIRELKSVSYRTFILGAFSTAIVAGISLTGVLLVHT
jgi:uncharacterized integral membrane protein (TIGR00698 family)